MANTALKAKTGLDIQSAYETITKGEKEGTAVYEKDHAYDIYLGFNKVIDKLLALIQEIANDYTVVIIVDELDRCIPEYAIKVMERLHHLTEEKTNIITIIAIDKKRLECSIRHLFGFAEDNKYLEKFINFEIRLDNGEVSENILEKYLLPSKSSFYGAILFTWCWMHGKRTILIQHTKGDIYSAISTFVEEKFGY